MILHQPKITLETLTEKELALYHNLDLQPYGKDLATQVAQKLLVPQYEGWGLYHSHRDYCGLGLFFDQGNYSMGVVNDGYGPGDPVITFEDQQEFTTWLANENDQSMALYGERFHNQTITKVRLEWFLEANYSPVWNDFCQYLRSNSEL